MHTLCADMHHDMFIRSEARPAVPACPVRRPLVRAGRFLRSHAGECDSKVTSPSSSSHSSHALASLSISVSVTTGVHSFDYVRHPSVRVCASTHHSVLHTDSIGAGVVSATRVMGNHQSTSKALRASQGVTENPTVNNSAAAGMEIRVRMDGPAETVVVSPADGIHASLRRELDIEDYERITVVFGQNVLVDNDDDEATTWLDVGAEEGSTVSLQIEPAPAYGYMSPRQAITTWAKERNATLSTLDVEPALANIIHSCEYDALLKFLMVGGGETGKTQLMLRYTDGPAFNSSTAYNSVQQLNHLRQQIGVDFKIKTRSFGGATIKQQIWDMVCTSPVCRHCAVSASLRFPS